MSSHPESRLFAVTRRTGRTRWYGRLLIVATFAVQGCVSAPPQPLVVRDAADRDVAVAPTAHRSAFGVSDSVRPREPAPWSPPDGTTPQLKRDGS